MNERWRYFIPGYIWALPMTIVGLLLVASWYFPRRIRWRDGCLEVMPRRGKLIGGEWVGGQTFGHVIFLRDERMLRAGFIAVHERVHVAQAMALGPLFPVLYGLFFLINLVKLRDWKKAYRLNWFEVQAYDRQASYERLNSKAWGSR